MFEKFLKTGCFRVRLTAPESGFPPYKKAAGPFKTSTRSTLYR